MPPIDLQQQIIEIVEQSFLSEGLDEKKRELVSPVDPRECPDVVVAIKRGWFNQTELSRMGIRGNRL